MNINENYKGRIRIIGRPGDTTACMVSLYDIDTEERIDNVARALISLDAEDDITISQLTYYATDEKGTYLRGANQEVIKKTVQIMNPELDITAQYSGERGSDA